MAAKPITEAHVIASLRANITDSMETLTAAQEELFKKSPDLSKVYDLLGDHVDPCCDAFDTVCSYAQLKRVTQKGEASDA